MTTHISRRKILQSAGAAALAPSAAPAATVPGPRREGPNTPKICLEMGGGGLAAGAVNDAGIRHTRTIYPEHPRAIDYDREHPGFKPTYPGGGGYAGFCFNVGFARAMQQAVLASM
jgi:hypothetical protein